MDLRLVSPFPRSAVPRVWKWIERFRDRVSDDFGAQTLEEFVQRWETTDQRSWGVMRDGELGGLITFQRLSPVCGTAHCVFRKDFWGWATTVPALTQIATEIFGDVEKLIFYVFEDNNSIRSLLRRLGAQEEGRLRKQTRRNGKAVNVLLYGLLKEELHGVEHYSGSHNGRSLEQSGSSNGNTIEYTELHQHDIAPITA